MGLSSELKYWKENLRRHIKENLLEHYLLSQEYVMLSGENPYSSKFIM